MIVGAVILKSGRIIDTNPSIFSRNPRGAFAGDVPFKPSNDNTVVSVYYSSTSEPTALRDKHELFDVEQIACVKPVAMGTPDIFGSFSSGVAIAIRDITRKTFGEKR